MTKERCSIRLVEDLSVSELLLPDYVSESADDLEDLVVGRLYGGLI